MEKSKEVKNPMKVENPIKVEKIKPVVYKFTGNGSFKIIFRGGYEEVIKNEAGTIMQTIKHPSLEAMFVNGQFETEDAELVKVMQLDRHWEEEYYWHSSMEKELKKLDMTVDKVKSEKIQKENIKRQDRKKVGIQNRIASGKATE